MTPKIDPLLGLHFRNVLGDVLRAQRGLARRFQAIAEFLTGRQADVADDRVLATVLFTDIVDSTRRAA
jgi:class 3 adenylate cyclase